jgi:peroxiredoxin
MRFSHASSPLPIVKPMPLKPGDKAPEFTLLDQHGEPFKLSKSIRRTKAAHLIYFYPGA